MKTSRYTDSQILAILKQAENGAPVPELCREHGMSSASFYKWRSSTPALALAMWRAPRPESVPSMRLRRASNMSCAVCKNKVRDLSDKLTNIQHDHHELILSTMHVHLDYNNGLEVLVVKGKDERIRSLADHLISTKGVKHGTLTITTTGKDIV